MFRKKLTEKNLIKKAEKLFNYLNLLKSITKEKYPLLEKEDIDNRNILLNDIDILIENLKVITKKYLNNNISIIEFNDLLNCIIESYNKLRVEKPMLNAIIYGYLTLPYSGGFGTPVSNAYSFEYLADRIKNLD